MKRQHKTTIAGIVGVAAAFALVIWTMGPVIIHPLTGFRRTPDELMKFIAYHNIVLLVDPVPVIRNGTGSYYDWAYAEILMRRRAAIVLWIAGMVPLGIWAAHRTREKASEKR